MEIKKKTLFVPGDWIWILLALAPIAALIAIAVYAPHAPAPVWVVTIAVAIAIHFGVVRRFVDRAKDIKAESPLSRLGMTDQGAIVIPLPGATFDMTTIGKISAAIAETCAHWAAPRAWFMGVNVTLESGPFAHYGDLAAGTQSGNEIRVMARPNDEKRTLDLVRHEAAHLILSRRGVPLHEHHEAMAREGWNY